MTRGKKRKFAGSPRGQRNWFEWCRANVKAVGLGVSTFAYGAAVEVKSLIPDLKGVSPWWIVLGIAVIGGGIVSAHEMGREKSVDNSHPEVPENSRS